LVEGWSCRTKVFAILNFDHQFKILTNFDNSNELRCTRLTFLATIVKIGQNLKWPKLWFSNFGLQPIRPMGLGPSTMPYDARVPNAIRYDVRILPPCHTGVASRLYKGALRIQVFF
jgi:hypothetical protein